MPPGDPRIVLPLALLIKLICDVSVSQNFGPPRKLFVYLTGQVVLGLGLDWYSIVL